MKRIFSLSFQYKVILAFLLFMNFSFFTTWYITKTLTQDTILHEKEQKLLAIAKILDTRLDSGGYTAILREHDANDASREDKISILNSALAKMTDEIGMSSPGLGVGFYSKDLDAIITYGPSASFGPMVGVSIPPEHPGRTVMQIGQPLVRSGSMVRGDIMNAMFPIVRDKKVIGYIWANELTTDIVNQYNRISRNISLALLLCFVLMVCLLILLSRRTVRDINSIINGVRAMRSDLSKRIKGTGGELQEVANSINAMAEDIGKANEETNRAMAIMQSVMSNVDCTVYVCDPETKKLVYVNDYFCELLGRKNLRGQICFQALHRLGAPCPFCPQPHLFDHEGNPTLTPIQGEIYLEDMHRNFLLTDRLVTWYDGRLMHMQVGTDITERKALAVAEAANMAQRDFLARMSHEIRTPMNGVLGMTYLAMQADPPPAQMIYLKKIHASASLLLGIINDILDFSRIEAGKLTVEKYVFNVRSTVENIRELILPHMDEKDLDLSITVDESVPKYVMGDELRFSQVLLNLLGNAAKFTLAGSVSLAMNAVLLPSGKLRLECSVNDTGIGMAMEQQESLFKPFSQADKSTSRKFGGTGLGLSISKALVEMMGGKIFFSSELGKGSVFSFHIEFEQADEPEDASTLQDGPWADINWKGYTFLLVEDNLINQEIALAMLSELGATVEVAQNGEEGLAAFLKKDYDLIFMDVRMPVMDGLEATRKIRASAKSDALSVPIIAMTANAMLEDREASGEAGMNGHLSKPLDVNELKKILSQQLHGSKPGADL